MWRSSKTSYGILLLFISVILIIFLIFHQSAQINSPDSEVKYMLNKYLEGRMEINRIDYARCGRIDSDKYEKEQGILYYITCSVDGPPGAEKIHFSAAIDSQGGVKFFDTSRGGQ